MKDSLLRSAVDTVEWEVLSSPVEFEATRVDSKDGHFGRISATRDSQYALSITMQGVETDWSDPTPPGQPGEFHEGVSFEGVDAAGRKIKVPRAFCGDWTRTLGRDGWQVTRSITGYTLERSNGDASPVALSEWFLSGPKGASGFFCRRTERIEHARYERHRHGPPGAANADSQRLVLPAHRPAESRRSSWDYHLVQAGDLKAVVSQVPNEFGPGWSARLAIEYRSEWGPLPSRETREAVSEIVGFLLGRHLLPVGHTTFDEDGVPLVEVARTPWGRDVVPTCRDPDFPPIHMAHAPGRAGEDIVSPIVARYLELRPKLDLSLALWTYWLANRQVVGFDLPLLSAALERIMKAWFKLEPTRRAGVFLSKSDFDKRTKDGLAVVAKGLEGVDHGARILRKMQGAFQMGANDRIEAFLEAIGLKTSPLEDQAMGARNYGAHGGDSKDPVADQARLGNAYKVLFHRVLLRLLGYDGAYIDYASIGHPRRPLSEAAGQDGP